MCNLDSNQTSFDEHCLTNTTTSSVKIRSTNIVKMNSSNLESIISSSRMVIMMDYVKNRPRKIILDTNYNRSKCGFSKNKEIQLLSEIVFGNFSLSSKANGFKLHIIKNPSKMIVSKLFNTPFNSVYFDSKSFSRKVSPDSGNNHSPSSNSSRSSNISCFSSSHSLSSSIINQCHLSNTNNDKIGNSISSANSSKNSSFKNIGLNSVNFNGITKSTCGNFFNENCDIYLKNSIMMSIIFTFNIPEENKAEFEEFIFHYYVLLESILNRISQLIFDNSFNIYNGNVIKCWKQSIKWLISLLPRRIPNVCNSSSHSFSLLPINTSQNMVNVHILEEILEYFDKQHRIQFLAQIMTGILLANQNSIFKFFNEPLMSHSDIFPYKHILQNLGVNIDNQSFNRIIVKGGNKDRRSDLASSWKDKISSSLKYYKKILNNSPKDQRNSCSQLDISLESSNIEAQTHYSDMALNRVSKDVEIITDFIAYLIRPVRTIAYQLHILPSDFIVNEAKSLKLDNKKSVIEIPLLNEGLILDKEVLPQINEIFYPNKIIDHVCNSITPLQGLVDNQNSNCNENFLEQLHIESQRSEITYNNRIFHPEFLVVDTDLSTVKVNDESILTSSWLEKVLTDLVSLTKVPGYCDIIGNLYLNAAINNFSEKAKLFRAYFVEKQTEKFDPWLMNKYGLSDSDLSLVLSVWN